MPELAIQPQYLYELGIHIPALPFEAHESTSVTTLGGGQNSDAYLLENGTVVKLTSTSGSLERMERIHRIMLGEFDLLSADFSAHMPDTEYHNVPLSEDNSRFKTLTVQEYVEGPRVGNYLDGPAPDVESVLDFYRKALLMRKRTGKIPDLACIEEKFFRARINSNVIVATDDQLSVTPMLIDTNFGKLQRSKSLGWLWTIAITNGVRRFVSQLENSVT